jgi:hypothetical protein
MEMLFVSVCTTHLQTSSETDCKTAPHLVVFAENDAIQKILVEEDFKKAPVYEAMRDNPHIATLISETDKVKYKKAV